MGSSNKNFKGKHKWNVNNTEILVQLRLSSKYIDLSKNADSCDMWQELYKDFIKKCPDLKEDFEYRDLRHRFRRIVREYGPDGTKNQGAANSIMLKKYYRQINLMTEFCYHFPRLINLNLSAEEEKRVIQEHEKRKGFKQKIENDEPRPKPIRKIVARKSSVRKIESEDISESIYLQESTEKNQSEELEVVSRSEYKEEMGKILERIDDIYNLLKNHLRK